MDEIVIKHCSEIKLSVTEGELFIEQQTDCTDPQLVNVPADRLPHFISRIKQLCDKNGISLDVPTKLNGHASLHN